ncbi:hypothetical protein Tco_0683274 [Tanacetum coccineum]|uniref:Uncharacterized protein n=1 Tax=Tanacetum coccineum TaxID=301880 RepID=A0ABQ4XTH4_9ASTR
MERIGQLASLGHLTLIRKAQQSDVKVLRRSTVIRLRIPERRFTHLRPPALVPTVDKAYEMILQDTLQVSPAEHKSLYGQENIVDDSSIPRNDEPNILGTRIEPRSNKESPKVEITKDKEVEITKETLVVEITNVVIPVNVNDDDEEITDEVYELKRREKGKPVEETRNSPIPTLIRKSFNTLADNLHDVMVETLPTMVGKHIKEQVPEQVQNQVLEVRNNSGSNLDTQLRLQLPMSFILKLRQPLRRSLCDALLREENSAKAAEDIGPNYKNLNKNDIKDIYLLIMNGKVPDYVDTRLLWSLSVFIRSIVIWERVHDFQLGIESYQQKYGYVQKDLTKEEAEYLKLFEEETEERLKHRRQMRRWEMFMNGRPLGPRRERPE